LVCPDSVAESQVSYTVQTCSASVYEPAVEYIKLASCASHVYPSGNPSTPTIGLADEIEEVQTGTHETAKPTSTNGFSSSAIPPPTSQAAPTSTVPSVLNGSPNGDAPSMPPPVDLNQPKYRWDFEHAAHVTSILSQTITHFIFYAFGTHQGSEQTMTGNVVLYIYCTWMTGT